ncbi:SusC/RagA family TonB-linked outer membrane protein [Spirosoma sp. HMF4905]|uniref:SusC/RagA family TonB-linked outer membrane protein n=1 Tax=Spirosoma arboris TaxID=2682092 RepID=A0A7K1S8M9_9BACT|nr:TonB-dependent receptor [Spirosoma arboris]MVM30147.1 SusC/RagA family TonB-linked outer membrane protein [Spirosoma arboris]
MDKLYSKYPSFIRLMKLSVTQLLIAGIFVSTTWAHSARGQELLDQYVRIKAGSTNLKSTLAHLERSTNVRFIYNPKEIQADQRVTLSARSVTLKDFLSELLTPLRINYEVSGKQIALFKNPSTGSTDSGDGIDQLTSNHLGRAVTDRTVSGRVLDGTNGSGLPGVSVVLKDTRLGTVTDGEGKFKLSIPEQYNTASATLIFSFIGYVSQEALVGSRSSVDVTLALDNKQLSEVVVVGYGTQSRKNLTTAISTIKPEELNRGAISDVGQLLQGKVPGLNISASGDPNTPSAVVLRGASTINSSQGPFYVIDGVPGADISIIAPDDIASIDVLKDAAATAIYGNRAANGVIMVTTKRGKKGQMQVSYSGYMGIEKVSSKLNMMDATQLRDFLSKNGQSFSPIDDKGANTNWQQAVEKNSAVSQNHNLSISGGSEHSNYSASINYLDKQGILQGSSLSRVIARLAVEQYALNDKVKFSLNVTNSNSNANNTPLRNNVLLQMINHLPVSPITNADGSYFENFQNTGYFNPVAMINHAKDNTKYNNLVGSFNTHVTLPFGLSYDMNLSYQNNTSLHGESYDSYYTQYNSANFYNNPDPPSVHSILNFGTNGSALRNTYQTTRKVLETFLTWDKSFGDHTINAVLGYSYQGSISGDGFQTSSTNFPVDNIGYNNFALSNPYAVSSYRINFGADGIYQETKLISDFARLNYNYKDKYLIQGSVRRDGSSVFGANNQWGYFPAGSVAWRVNQEGFMQNQKLFNDLKVRASYGVTGNSSGFNAYTAQFISGSLGTYYYNGVQTAAYGPTQAANPNLQWEKTATTNIGVDFTVLKGKLSGTVEWYNKETTGMIYSYRVDPILVPVGSIIANGGNMSNKGIEVSLSATPVQKGKFSWTTGLNLAHNTNKINSLTNPLFVGGDSVRITQPEGAGQTGSTLQILKAGMPLGQFFTLQYAGKNDKGVSQYVDHNGNLTTTPVIGTDYKYMGSPQPKLLVGWTNTLRYGNLDFNVFFRGVFGNKIFNATRADLFRPSTAQFTNILVDAADEKATDVNSFKYSSRFIEDGSYVRLDNATLGYNFKNLGQYVKTIRVYASVNNAFVITSYKGIDPEVNQGGIAPGIDANNFYPKTRTILIGLNASF